MGRSASSGSFAGGDRIGRVLLVDRDPMRLVEGFEPLRDQLDDLGDVPLDREGDRLRVVLDPVPGRRGEMLLEVDIEVFQAGDDHDRGRHAVGEVRQTVDIARGNRTLASSRSLMSSSWSRQRIRGTDSTAPMSWPEQGDDPLGGAGVGPGREAAESLAVGGGEVLAPEVLQDAAPEPRVVALEVEQGSDEVEVDIR